MSPRTATFLTALGLLAAGAPLPFLMHPQEHDEHHHHACCGHHHEQEHIYEGSAEVRVPTALRSSHRLRSVRLMLGNRVLAETDGGGALWEPTLTLPAAESYDIEVRAVWEDEAPHALTLTLDVPRRETQSVTQWGEKTLRTLFRFSW